MNPAGVMFGQHAQIECERFLCRDDSQLSEAGRRRQIQRELGSGDVLTSAPVSAFGFLNSTPGAVSITGSNTVDPNTGKLVQGKTLNLEAQKSFSVVAGDITVNSRTIVGAGSRVNLVSVKSAGEAKLDATALASDLNSPIDVTQFTAMGAVDITDSSRINTNLPLTSPHRAELGGPVFIRGGTFLLDASYITSPSYSGDPQQNLVSNIDVQAHDVRIVDGARISASTGGSAAAGNVTVNADSLLIDGTGIDGKGIPTTGLFALGQGGDQTGSAGHVTVTSGHCENDECRTDRCLQPGLGQWRND